MARRWIISLLAPCAAAVAVFGGMRAWESRPVRERRAAFHLSRGLAAQDSAQARAEFRAATRLQPDGVEARRKLAALENDLGNWELAFLESETLVEMHPEDAAGWTALAALMMKQGWLEAPEAALDRAVEIAPALADARALRADVRQRLGRYHGARLDAEAAHATLPASRDPAPPRQQRGVQIDVGSLGSWAREAWPGRLATAREELQAAIDKSAWPDALRAVDSARTAYPQSFFAPYLAGVLELARGNTAAAGQSLLDALAIAPRNPTAISALARAWATEKSSTSAAARLMELAERDPSFALARYLAARAYVEARDPVHAEAALRRGMQLQPDSPVPYQHLADYFAGLDRMPEAIEICAAGLERFPRDVALAVMQAQISAALGRTADAARAYESVLAARPDLDIVEYRLGMLLAGQDKDPSLWQRARRILEDLRSDAPADPMLVDVLGWLSYRAGDPRRARELLEAASKALPGEPRPHFHLAAVYAHENRRDLSVKELQAALGSGRPFAERLEAMRLLRETQPANARAGDR